MSVSKEHILAEIRRTASENDGKPLGRSRFAKVTGIYERDWSGRYWARWNDAVREAGFEPNKLQEKYDDEDILASLAIEVRRIGRMPTKPEIKLRHHEDSKFPSEGVFERLGSKLEITRKVAEYCRNRSDCADVLAIIEPLLNAKQQEKSPVAPAEDVKFGFVYLMKSGRFYKIGRTNSVGRRERELAIQLPDRADTVHVIKTDDPVGIEAYWHARFAGRRRNGEWFELTPDDVAAFKRRKFM